MASMELVRSHGLSDQFRVDVARLDLARIQQVSEEQLAIHEYAVATAISVKTRGAALQDTLPNAAKVAALREERNSVSANDATNGMTLTQAARQAVAPKPKTNLGKVREVSDADSLDIAKQVLTSIHPDREQDLDVKTVKENLFKGITEAKNHDDAIAEHNQLARTLAIVGGQTEIEKPSLLELSRYRAHLAAAGGVGRFDSREAVDAWKEQELRLMPHRGRATMLVQVVNTYVELLGGGNGAPISVPESVFPQVKEGLDAAKHAFDAILTDEPDPQILEADLPRFDGEFERLVDMVALLSRSCSGGYLFNRIAWGNVGHRYTATAIADLIAQAAKTLEKYRMPLDQFSQLLGSFALGRAGLSIGTKDRGRSSASSDPFAKKRIFDDMRESNFINEKDSSIYHKRNRY